MKTYRTLSTFFATLALTSAGIASAASVNSADNVVTLPAFVVQATRLSSFEANIQSSLTEMREAATGPVVPTMALPINHHLVAPDPLPAPLATHDDFRPAARHKHGAKS
ncbi:MAG: hypothetical protein PHQ04_06550 [Opitutaceae bacterium]|nr:hypothetical protein [Opitutaceae bacterium]